MSRIKLLNGYIKKASIAEGSFVSVETPKNEAQRQVLSPFGNNIIPQKVNKSKFVLRQSRRGDLHPFPSGDNPDAPLSEFRRQTTTGAQGLWQNLGMKVKQMNKYWNWILDIRNWKLEIPTRSQAGIVSQLLLLLLLVGGIGLGTYLIGQKTNLLPKAAVGTPYLCTRDDFVNKNFSRCKDSQKPVLDSCLDPISKEEVNCGEAPWLNGYIVYCRWNNECPADQQPPANQAGTDQQGEKPSGSLKVDSVDCSKKSQTGTCRVNASFGFNNCSNADKDIYWLENGPATNLMNKTTGKFFIDFRYDDTLYLTCKTASLASAVVKLDSNEDQANPQAPAVAAPQQAAAGGCDPKFVNDNCKGSGTCYINSQNKQTCLFSNSQSCSPDVSKQCNTDGLGSCRIVGGEQRCQYSAAQTDCVGKDLQTYGKNCVVINRTVYGVNYRYSDTKQTCNDGWWNYCYITQNKGCVDKPDGVPGCEGDPKPRTPGGVNPASQAVNPASAGGQKNSSTSTSTTTTTTSTVNPNAGCGKNAEGVEIPCFAIGSFDEAALFNTKAGAGVAAGNYKIYTDVLGKINAQIQDAQVKAATALAQAKIDANSGTVQACVNQ